MSDGFENWKILHVYVAVSSKLYSLYIMSDIKKAQLANISASYTNYTAATSLPTSVLCSPCVLSLYQQLQGTAYSYYYSIMATEWATIQKTCGVSFPTAVPVNPTSVTAIPGYAPNNFTTSNVCYSGNTYTVASGDNCIAISKAKGVSTGALINMNSLLPDCSNLQGTSKSDSIKSTLSSSLSEIWHAQCV